MTQELYVFTITDREDRETWTPYVFETLKEAQRCMTDWATKYLDWATEYLEEDSTANGGPGIEGSALDADINFIDGGDGLWECYFIWQAGQIHKVELGKGYEK